MHNNDHPCITCAHVGIFRWCTTCASVGHHPRTQGHWS